MKVRTFFVLAMVFLCIPIIPVFTGGAQEKGGEVEFLNWVTAEEATRVAVEGIIEDFKKENPGIEVVATPQGFSDILGQASIRFFAGDPPDLVQAAGPNITLLAKMGALAPAEDVFPADFIDDLQPSAYRLTEVDGVNYGIPWTPAPVGLWYNRDLMKQAGLDPKNPPKTIYEFKEAIKQAREKLPSDIVILGYDTSVRAFGFEYSYPFLLAFGARPFEGDTVNFDTPEVKEFMEWMRELVESGSTLPGRKIGEFRPLAAQGRLLFMIDPSFVKGIILSINEDMTSEEFDKQWGVTAIPGDEDGKHYAYASDHQLAVFADSPNKEAAAKLAMHLVNSDYALKNYILKTGYIPATKSALERFPQFEEDLIIKTFLNEVSPTVVNIPYSEDYEEIAVEFMAGVQQVITSDKPIDEVIDTIQRAVDKIQ